MVSKMQDDMIVMELATHRCGEHLGNLVVTVKPVQCFAEQNLKYALGAIVQAVEMRMRELGLDPWQVRREIEDMQFAQMGGPGVGH